MIQQITGTMPACPSASAIRSKHTRLRITPAVNRSSRLMLLSEGLWRAVARAPPRASPPTPVTAVMTSIVR